MIHSINTKNISDGDTVRFYDSIQAQKDKDYSGANPDYYPIGKVIRVYDYKSPWGHTDEVCDIQIGDRISKSHFTRCVEIVD